MVSYTKSRVCSLIKTKISKIQVLQTIKLKYVVLYIFFMAKGYEPTAGMCL